LHIVKPEKKLLSLKPLPKMHFSNRRYISSKARQCKTLNMGIQFITVMKNQEKTPGTEIT